MHKKHRLALPHCRHRIAAPASLLLLIPTELILMIIEYISAQDLRNLAATSKLSRHLVQRFYTLTHTPTTKRIHLVFDHMLSSTYLSNTYLYKHKPNQITTAIVQDVLRETWEGRMLPPKPREKDIRRRNRKVTRSVAEGYKKDLAAGLLENKGYWRLYGLEMDVFQVMMYASGSRVSFRMSVKEKVWQVRFNGLVRGLNNLEKVYF